MYTSHTDEANQLKKGILVVDDDEDLLFAYRLLLEKENTKVYTTNDVDKAQDIARREKIHLAILDYMMPKLRGDQLARRLIAINPDIKIIFVSGYNEVIEVAKKLEFTIYGVFMKPFDPNVMEKLAESNDYADFILNSAEMPPLNRYTTIVHVMDPAFF